MSDKPTCWDVFLDAFLRRFDGADPAYLAKPRPNEEFAENFAWELYGFPGGGGVKGYRSLRDFAVARADRLRELQDRGNVSMDDVKEFLRDFPLTERLQSRTYLPSLVRRQLTPEEYWEWRGSVEHDD
jgi:hypothetical protein